jgi:integrase
MLKVLRGQHVPAVLHGPVLVDRLGIPRYWATIWNVLRGCELARSTQIKKLRAIESLYEHSDELLGHGALEKAIGRLDEHQLATVLESWLVSIKNRPAVSESDEKRWKSGLHFVVDTVGWITASAAPGQLKSIEPRLHRISLLYSQLHVRRAQELAPIRSLSSNVAMCLYELLDPASAGNPFQRVKTKWLAFTAFVLMLHQGLRRGELLTLSADCLRSAFDTRSNRRRYWINVTHNPHEFDDLRHSRPELKTVNAIRQLPVSETTALILQTYVENFRGRPDHPYLLNSQQNKPLSTESLTKFFDKASNALPFVVSQELEDRLGRKRITPHDLRHTCATVRLNQLLSSGDSMDIALEKMRSFFGWSRESMMPTRYARATFDDEMSRRWGEIIDDTASMLRAL